jgi:hypothetical protein
MIKHKKSSIRQQRIDPHPILKRYMWEKLQIEKKKEQAKMGGGGPSEEELRRFNTIRNDKKRVLEKVIFPAMANLIFFFESIDQEPILNEAFEDDMLELLGIRRNGPSPTNYGLFFVRLFRSILGVKLEYDRKDYRLRLMHEGLKIINSKMGKIIPTVYQNVTGSDYFIKYVSLDMGRALSWTETVSREVEDLYRYKIIHESEDIAKQREKFIKHASLEAPDKTLDIDTKGILHRGN